MEFSCPEGSSRAWTSHRVSLPKKPSQRPLGTHWQWDAPEKANLEPLAPNLASLKAQSRKGECGPRKEHWAGSPEAGPPGLSSW